MKPLLLALVAIATFPVASCADDTSTAENPNQRLIDIYGEVIPAVATHQRPDLPDDEPLDLIVYVTPRENVDINVDVQVGLVNALDEWADIRFIDELEEAIAINEPGQPVRDDSVLVGLGSVPDGTASVELAADRYESADELTTFELTLRRQDGEWSIVEPPEGTRVTLR
ncbi:MAG: hypothetical protein ACLFRV_07225 [Acidimicrobiales bacterium]